MNVVKLKTGVYVCSRKGADGTVRIHVMNQKQMNRYYRMNVWWNIVRYSLSSWGIETQSK